MDHKKEQLAELRVHWELLLAQQRELHRIYLAVLARSPRHECDLVELKELVTAVAELVDSLKKALADASYDLDL